MFSAGIAVCFQLLFALRGVLVCSCLCVQLSFNMSSLSGFVASVAFEKKDESWNVDIIDVLKRNEVEVRPQLCFFP